MALAAGFGSLVVAAVSIVLAIGIWSARENTLDLIKENAQLAISLFVRQVSQHLDPPRAQLEFIAAAIASGRVRPEDSAEFSDVLFGAMAATPQVRVLGFIDTDYQAIAAYRGADGVRINMADDRADEVVRTAVDAAAGRDGAFWGPPVWRSIHTQTLINVRQPVRRDGQYLGMLVAAVGINELSAYLDELEGDVGDNAFILYDRDFVLAHSLMGWGYAGLSEEKPLPRLAEFGDPVLSAMWDPRYRREPLITVPPPLRNHLVVFGGEPYVFVYQEIAGFSDRPWIVGSYFRTADVGEHLRRLRWAIGAGAAALVLSVVIAVLFGRRVARPVVRLAQAAAQIRGLELDRIAELPRSRIRELDEQATSFNAMVGGLRWFETYVPKKLVNRLMQSGDADGLSSDARNVTVMFSDIAGFSQMSENTPAAEVAAFLNEHFAIVAACIEAEEGTVDKFMGDAVMAFWGAPEKQKNRAIRACRAALAIAAAIKRDNENRRRSGKPPVRVRIGIHSGKVTVGNIGAPGRLNYTIIGDTVNIGQRLEQLGKQVYEQEPEVAIVISAATAADLDDSFSPISVGFHQLRGRDAPVEVFRLV
ncbi:MAG: adenylate/guanylate cyclase domain-containing protein [Alphaproteobacteria bacterium]|nr:adenylate/guanylate cyclase domain-containing protein [Alphaproteobacteria bacterium]